MANGHSMPPLADELAEISFTILTISSSLIAVFTPLMFMGGVVGIMMREFALTLSAAVAVSVLLSLTLTPMLCARFLKPPKPPSSPFMKALEASFQQLESSYAKGLDVVLRHKLMTLVVFGFTVILTGLLYTTAQTGFFPQQDTGFIQGTVVTPQGTPFAYTARKSLEAMKIIAADPDIDEAHYNAGGSAQGHSMDIGLRSRADGRRSECHRHYLSTGCMTKAGADRRHPGDPAGHAGHHNRRALGARPIPVHPIRRRPG